MKNNAANQQEKAILPTIQLPKGGGAIHTMGEKFAVNAVTGTGSFSIPVPVSPGRHGFQPNPTLAYNSGTGNTPYGLGWNIELPSISRKTSKGLPQYNDLDETDVFVLSGAEDLVPFLEENNNWERRVDRASNPDYTIHFYRPRTEGSFARIEKWVNKLDSSDTHWRTTSRENVSSIYGRSSRIVNPADPTQIFEWLLEESRDNRGNIIQYTYQDENTEGIDPSSPSEYHRLQAQESFAQRYIKRIQYGNQQPDLSADWHFEIVFDYGDHDELTPSPNADRPWDLRADPFSTYRQGFEVRTYRLCQRMLLFHHFDALNDNTPTLIRSTSLEHNQCAVASTIKKAWQTGYIKQDVGYSKKEMPALSFTYTDPTFGQTIQSLPAESLENWPAGLGGNYQFVDLEGEGIAGILTQQADAWFYKPNLGNGCFGSLQLLGSKPALSGAGQPQIQDLDGDGKKELVIASPEASGYYNYKESSWENFTPFDSMPNIDWGDPNVKLVDLTGDGFADILITAEEVIRWHPSKAKQGYERSQTVRKALDEQQGPTLVFADRSISLYLADMSGDGLSDLVRINNNDIAYWPNLGYGQFGAKVTMGQAPLIDHPDLFERANIRLADIDGTGTTDLLYFGCKGAQFWINQAGNTWSSAHRLEQFPSIDQVVNVQLADLFGHGTPCLIWSSPLPQDAESPVKYIDLLAASQNQATGKPYLLYQSDNNMGKLDRLFYAPSTRFYLQDKLAGTPWVTKLHFPVYVVEKAESIDQISASILQTSYTYHHGYFDPDEREFRGFGRVDQLDAENFETFLAGNPNPEQQAHFAHPILTKTWFHTGAYLQHKNLAAHYASEFFREEEHAPFAQPNFFLPNNETEFIETVDFQSSREAHRAFRGQAIRQEVYALDQSDKAHVPYTVTATNSTVREVQPRRNERHAVFLSVPNESITFHYERNCCDPRVKHAFTLEVDRYGTPLKSAEVVYPRRENGRIDLPTEQLELHMVLTEKSVIHRDEESHFYALGIPSETKSLEVSGIVPDHTYFSANELRNKLTQAEELPFHANAIQAVPQKRLFQWSKQFYWATDLSEALPHGAVHWPILAHHATAAQFTPELIEQAFGDKLTPEEIQEKGGFRLQDDYWWNDGPITHYTYRDQPAENDLRNRENPFRLPVEVQEPLEANAQNRMRVFYDANHLLPESVDDPEGHSSWSNIDYRTLSPVRLLDLNENVTEALTDELGMVIATSSFGTEEKADGTIFTNGDLPIGEYQRHFPNTLEEIIDDPKRFLQGASVYFHYDLSAWQERQEPLQFITISRETHARVLNDPADTEVQVALGYSDGFGRELQQKALVEGGVAHLLNEHGGLQLDTESGTPIQEEVPTRWLSSGRTVVNNKQKPIKQYEPFYVNSHRYLAEEEATKIGLTAVLHYDPLMRLIRTDTPKGFHSKVDFTAWESTSFDLNDTVKQSDYYRGVQNQTIPATQEEKAALDTALAHQETSSTSVLDSLGRTFQTIELDGDGNQYVTETTFNISGQPTTITDPRQWTLNQLEARQDNPIHNFRYQYAMSGALLHTQAMDAGDSWLFANALEKPVFNWSPRGFKTEVAYDELQRTVEIWVEGGDFASPVITERMVYAAPDILASKNQRGQLITHYDQGGKNATIRVGFKGDVLANEKRFVQLFDPNQPGILLEHVGQTFDWNTLKENNLEAETFTTSTEINALGRIIQSQSADQSIHYPTYNHSGQLVSVAVQLRSVGERKEFVSEVTYNQKGQREAVRYGNGAQTRYRYDTKTYQLTRLTTSRPNAPELLQDLHYLFDPMGNITRIEDRAQADIYFNNQVVQAANSYTYDAFYQLKSATGREHMGQNGTRPVMEQVDPLHIHAHRSDGQQMRNYTRTYDYDEAGNMLRSHHNAGEQYTRSFEYDSASNRLLKSGVGQDINWQHYSYDAAGNMQEMAHLNSLIWNYKNEIQRLEKNDLSASYEYDASGERSRKIVQKGANKIQLRYYVAGAEIFREYDNGILQTERETLHLLDDLQRIVMVDTQTIKDGQAILPEALQPLIRYQLSNHLGSASIELDEKANVISYEEYYPFGESSYQAVDSSREVPRKRYRYTGMERDEESGLNYHSARYYAPWLCRWVKPDPAGTVDGLNVYRYTMNNPIKYADPSGQESKYQLQISDELTALSPPDNFSIPLIDADQGNFRLTFNYEGQLHASRSGQLQDPALSAEVRTSSMVNLELDFYDYNLTLAAGSFNFLSTGGLGTNVGDNELFTTSGKFFAGSFGSGSELPTATSHRLFQNKLELNVKLRDSWSVIYGLASYNHGKGSQFSPFSAQPEGIAFVGFNYENFSFITYNDVKLFGGPGTDHLWTAGGALFYHLNARTTFSAGYDAFTGTFKGRQERFDCAFSPDGCYIQTPEETALNRNEWSFYMYRDNWFIGTNVLLPREANGQHVMHDKRQLPFQPPFDFTIDIAGDSAEFEYLGEGMGLTGFMINFGFTH